ncbi:MAG TPA: hypothetical protein VGI85_10450 [Chthoniobacterales bacterium]|jgi:hypothetical protein
MADYLQLGHAEAMTTKALSLLAILLLGSVSYSSGGTVPARTVLVVRTLVALSSVDAPGTVVPVQLVDNVTVNGKVVLPAGTKLNGKVQTSRRTVTSSQRLTVNLVSVNVGQHSVPIKTTGAYQVNNENFRSTRTGAPVGRANYTVAAGRKMTFHLAEPLTL